MIFTLQHIERLADRLILAISLLIPSPRGLPLNSGGVFFLSKYGGYLLLSLVSKICRENTNYCEEMVRMSCTFFGSEVVFMIPLWISQVQLGWNWAHCHA